MLFRSCVQGRIYQKGVVSRSLRVLIDTGFTGSVLLKDALAHKLKFVTIPAAQPIQLAEGTTIHSAHIAPNLSFSLGDSHTELCDALLFPLKSYDVVLGM